MVMDEIVIVKSNLAGDAHMEIQLLLIHAGRLFLILLIIPYIQIIVFLIFTSMTQF